MSHSSPIPMAADVARLVGDTAQQIDNHSLLLQKFAAPKSFLGEKQDDANRWSMLRVARYGEGIIATELKQKQQRASRGGDSKVARQAEMAVQVLPGFKRTAAPPPVLESLRKRHTRSLQRLVESSPFPAFVVRARLRSRLAVNLSDSLIPNAGISLDRIFSSPLIPGSAVKGNARHVALAELKELRSRNAPELAEAVTRFVGVFGCTEEELKCGTLSQFNADGLIPQDRRGGVNFLPASVESSTGLVVEL
ncbi:MAG: hypothetical protein ACFB21_15790, partial [Opitutales bacterium]